MARLTKGMPRFLRRAAGRAKYAYPGPTGWPGSLVTPSIAGIVVTPQTALSFTAFFAGIHVISEDVASLPLAVFRRKPRGGQRLVKDHPVSRLMARCPDGPSNLMSSMQWREAWIAHALQWGNGFAEIEFTVGGEAVGLNLLNPANVVLRRDPGADPHYQVTREGSVLDAGRLARVPPSRMLHLGCLGFNGLIGYSPVGLGREAIGLGKAAEQFGAGFFGNGARPGGFLKYPGRLTPEARGNIRDSWNAIHRGSASAGKVGILEEGLDWEETQVNPEEAQFLETRRFQVLEVCRILRLPPHKLQDYSQAHLANIEHSNIDYLMTTLRPWCVRIEECMGLKLLTEEETRAGYYIRHDISAMLRANVQARADYYQKMFQFGMSPDEIRELEGMNPIGSQGGGDKRYVPANMVELDAETRESERQEAEGETGPDVTPDEAAGFAAGRFEPCKCRRKRGFSREKSLL